MKDTPLSKVRAQRARKRQKDAEAALNVRSPFRENPVVGLALALCLWAVSVLAIAADGLFDGRSGPEYLLPLVGDAVLLLAAIFAYAGLLRIIRPAVIRRNHGLSVLVLASALPVILGSLLLYVLRDTTQIPIDVAHCLLPLAMAPLLATILLDAAAGVAAGLWTSLVLAMLAGRSLPVFIAGVIATVVASLSAGHVRTRSKVIRTGMAVGLSQTVVVFGLTALNWARPDIMLVVNQAGACIIGGFLSAVAVLLILPLFEALFHITTDISLLELSDLGHPLLQRLAMEAPGTYHHSLIVANLAQAAADEIGANSLLARVASYYHDVGKLTKPDFFAENLQMRQNPHDTLPPSMSTLVITAHVKEGLSLAMLHKLPRIVTRVIVEHHGTSVLSYFHHKARKSHEIEEEIRPTAPKTNGTADVNEESFRYSGPRPGSPESAIICLADAVEAASRTATKVTPGHLEGLVNELVEAKTKDGQLDESGLTLGDLVKIKKSFVFTLRNMFHGRVPYPKDEDRDNQPAEGAQAERRKNSRVDSTPAAAGRRTPA
ncbi:MAG: HDIG domain-containing protein [Lentisphaerae bacterium]|nr:HDIG domain-containing protein [Lentisphaerota bacterium]